MNFLELPNVNQSNEERQAKYWLCRSLGANSYWAARMRDWPVSKIERKYGLQRSNKKKPILDRLVEASEPFYSALQSNIARP